MALRMPAAPSSRPSLPSTFAESSPAPVLHYQGAEALLYQTTFLSFPSTPTASLIPPLPAALKHRPAKPYRHPQLDAKLTRHRILSEARVLAKLRRDGLNVPALYTLDWEDGWLMMEWIEGGSVRKVLDERLVAWLARMEKNDVRSAQTKDGLWDLMGRIGCEVARMHQAGVVHGDLTTSNILLRESSTSVDQAQNTGSGSVENELGGQVVLIDFGLSEQSTAVEDRAVDLYVLERAFGSTHPRTEGLFGEVLRAYGQSYKGAKVTLKRLAEVRMRGRKKIMLG